MFQNLRVHDHKTYLFCTAEQKEEDKTVADIHLTHIFPQSPPSAPPPRIRRCPFDCVCDVSLRSHSVCTFSFFLFHFFYQRREEKDKLF